MLICLYLAGSSTAFHTDEKALLLETFCLSIFLPFLCVSFHFLIAQACLTLCDPMDCSSPGSSVHGMFQARILEQVAISFSRRSSWPRDWTQVSHIVGRCFTIWATGEVYFSIKMIVKVEVKKEKKKNLMRLAKGKLLYKIRCQSTHRILFLMW